MNAAYQAHYDALAIHDLQTPVLAEDYTDAQADNMMVRIGDVRGKQVIEVGCGRGVLTRSLAAFGAQVTAVDLCPDYLVRLASNRVRTIQADADDLPFNAEFDVLVSTDCMEHTLRPGGFLHSINRALKPGGLAYLRVPYRENLLAYSPRWCAHDFVHLRSYNKALLRDTLRGAGFKVERFWLDGFSFGTPQPWFINTRLSNRYNIYAEWLKARGVDPARWPSLVARLFMRPCEITVRARKVKAIEPMPGGTLYRLV